MTEPVTQQDEADIGTLSYEQAREELVTTVKRLEAGNLPSRSRCGCGNAERHSPTAAKRGSTVPANDSTKHVKSQSRTTEHFVNWVRRCLQRRRAHLSWAATWSAKELMVSGEAMALRTTNMSPFDVTQYSLASSER